MFRDQSFQRTLSAGNVVLGLKRIDHIMTEEFSGIVHNRDLATRADAGIDSEYRELARRRGEQHILEIFPKNLDSIGVRAPLQLQTDFRCDGAV